MDKDTKAQVISKVIHIQTLEELDELNKLLRPFKKREVYFDQENQWQFLAANTYLKNKIAKNEGLKERNKDEIAETAQMDNDLKELALKANALDSVFVESILKLTINKS